MSWHDDPVQVEERLGPGVTLELVQEDAERKTKVFRDSLGRDHHYMRAEPAVFYATAFQRVRCTARGCETTAVHTGTRELWQRILKPVLRLFRVDRSKGWQHHPVGGWRCPAHPWSR